MPTASSRTVMVWTGAIALLTLVASVAGLTDPTVYAQETTNWATQAQGQDVGNLLAVVVLLVAGAAYSRGSRRAALVWLGTLLYLVYAFVVYTMAIHVNYLFLVYVGVLGLSAWALIFHVGDVRSGCTAYPQGRPRSVAAWVLIVTGVVFAALWLSELVPALVGGTVPASLEEAGLWVNPIHVIDLSLVLPGFVISGVAALQGRGHGLFWVAPWLVFAVLMASSIVAAMLLMTVEGDREAVPIAVLVSVLVVVSLVAVRVYLAHDASGD